MSHRFHLTFRVRDLEAARAFYGELLGGEVANQTATSTDFSFFGSDLTCRLAPDWTPPPPGPSGPALRATVSPETFTRIAARLEQAGTSFLEPPQDEPVGKLTRRKMAFLDPSGNALLLQTALDETLAFDA